MSESRFFALFSIAALIMLTYACGTPSSGLDSSNNFPMPDIDSDNNLVVVKNDIRSLPAGSYAFKDVLIEGTLLISQESEEGGENTQISAENFEITENGSLNSSASVDCDDANFPIEESILKNAGNLTIEADNILIHGEVLSLGEMKECEREATASSSESETLVRGDGGTIRLDAPQIELSGLLQTSGAPQSGDIEIIALDFILSGEINSSGLDGITLAIIQSFDTVFVEDGGHAGNVSIAADESLEEESDAVIRANGGDGAPSNIDGTGCLPPANGGNGGDVLVEPFGALTLFEPEVIGGAGGDETVIDPGPPPVVCEGGEPGENGSLTL